MSGLKQLKTQINTVQTTMKITSAMRMISVSNLRKSHGLLLNAYPYLDEITRMLRRLVRSVSYRQEQKSFQAEESDIILPALLKGKGEEKKHVVVCVTSDEGLCGRFNFSVIDKTTQVIKHLLSQKQQHISIVCIGARGGELLCKKFPSLPIHTIHRKGHKDIALFLEAERTAMNLIDSFYRDLFDVCTVVYSEFESAAVQKIKVEQMIPLETFQHHDIWDFMNDSEDPHYVRRDALGQKQIKHTAAQLLSAIGGKDIKSPLGSVDADALLKESTRLPDSYDYEASDLQILDYMLPLFVEAHVYKILLNSMASESAARMIAMEGASKNAKEMMKVFNKKYHRRRQEMVTKDLTEVISGSMS
ncbi:MAG: ATP synthase F1 subunit gamma [Alphaproteobacteria bacterium]|nr:ATP synthase F1 subunit gamma [Alphaproteobacteria bacterium]